MPSQMPVMSKRVGAANKKGGSGAHSKRRPEGGQESDTDSGSYQVRNHTVQKRQQPQKFNRLARGTYFDRVLNNSEDSYDESSENDGSYICDDCKVDADDNYLCRRCKMNSVGRRQSPLRPSHQQQRYNRQNQSDEYSPYSRRPRAKENDYEGSSRKQRMPPREKYPDHLEEDDESFSESESSPPRRRITALQPERQKRSGGPQRDRQQRSHPRLETPDRRPIERGGRQERQKKLQKIDRIEQTRNQKEIEYDSDDDEYDSENFGEIQAHRHTNLRQRTQSRKHVNNDKSPPRVKQTYREVVERKTTTRASRQNGDDVKIKRRQIPDESSSESWSEASEESEESEHSREYVEFQRRNPRHPNRKEHFQYEAEGRSKSQGRPVYSKNKSQGPPYRAVDQITVGWCESHQR